MTVKDFYFEVWEKLVRLNEFYLFSPVVLNVVYDLPRNNLTPVALTVAAAARQIVLHPNMETDQLHPGSRSSRSSFTYSLSRIAACVGDCSCVHQMSF